MATLKLPQILENAKSAYEAEDYEEAARYYEMASSLYSQQDNPLDAAEMANNRSVSLLRSGNPQQALGVVQGTEKIFAAAGDVRRQAMALGNQAAALEALHQTDQAITYYLQTNDLLKSIQERELRGYVLQSLSGLQLKKRQYLQALATMQSALDLKKKLSLREQILQKLLQVVFRLLGR